jgi:hypothetical protein
MPLHALGQTSAFRPNVRIFMIGLGLGRKGPPRLCICANFPFGPTWGTAEPLRGMLDPERFCSVRGRKRTSPRLANSQGFSDATRSSH